MNDFELQVLILLESINKELQDIRSILEPGKTYTVIREKGEVVRKPK